MKGRLEFWFYVSVAVGMALATSSFTVLSGIFQVQTGVGAVIGIIIAGVLCLVLSLSIAELASMFPSAPGIRTYFKQAFGSSASLVLVYLYLTFTVLMAGVEGYMFALVVAAVTAANPILTVTTLLLSVTAINLAGLELPRGAQMAITLFAVALLVLVSIVGTNTSGHLTMPIETPLWGALPAATGLAVFLYMGFEWATPIGLRAKSYERLIPRALPVSVLILMAIYIMFTITAARWVPRSVLGASPISHVPVYQAVFGRIGTFMLLALVVGASGSTFNAGIMGGARLLFMLTNDGYLPKWVGSTSERGAPIGATLLLGGGATIATAAVIRFQLQLVLAVVGAAIMCFVYGAFALAVLVLRKKKTQLRRPYRTPIPLWAQRGLVVVLPLLGLGSLFSLPNLIGPIVLWTAGSICVSLILAGWSTRRASGQARAAEIPA